jgi:hypothetical protein
VDGRRGAGVIAIAAYGGCLAVVAVVTVLDGRVRSILVVPLALAFYWGFSVLIGSVCAIIFSERSEDWTRGGMLVVAVGAAMVALGFLALANWIGSVAVMYAFGLLSGTGFWVCLAALGGAIFGRLPEIGMAEGD